MKLLIVTFRNLFKTYFLKYRKISVATNAPTEQVSSMEVKISNTKLEDSFMLNYFLNGIGYTKSITKVLVIIM